MRDTSVVEVYQIKTESFRTLCAIYRLYIPIHVVLYCQSTALTWQEDVEDNNSLHQAHAIVDLYIEDIIDDD